MTPQLLQTAQWMNANARTIRYQPVTGLPSAERFTQIERLINATWSVINDLGFNPGPKPTIHYSGAGPSFPHVLLGSLTELSVETLAMYHMLGLSAVMATGVREYTDRKPATPPPNYRVILDETFSEEESDAIFPTD